MRLLGATLDIPPEVLQSVGQIIVRWSFIDWRLSHITYDLLDIGPKEGRIAVTEPRASLRVDNIELLLSIKRLKINTDLKPLKTRLDEARAWRDRFAHGIWARDANTQKLFIRNLSGTWQPTRGMRGKIARRIKPEAVPINEAKCQAVLSDINSLINTINELEERVRDALLALRQKPAEQ